MTITETLPLVKCTTCHSHIGIKHLSSHVCPLSQSHRFSQVSHYDDIILNNNDIAAIMDKAESKNIYHHHSNNNNICSRCHHGNASITMAKKYYHLHCFTCFICRSSLSDPNNPPMQFESQIYCRHDYSIIITRPSCATCKKTIESFVRPTIALGNYYHPEHIRCHHCHKPVDPDMTGLVERKGKIYCQTDFNRLYLPKCESCHRAIEKEAVISLDGKLQGTWHKYCFKCQLCGICFIDNKFYIYNNAPYCRLDYHKLNNSICKACQTPIEGSKYAETLVNWKFHPSCFTCHICHTYIQDVYFVFENHIYCQKHDLHYQAEERKKITS